MAWIEGRVCLPDHNAQETEAFFAKCLEHVTALERIGAGPPPHVTLLYHGHAVTPQLDAVVQCFNVAKVYFAATVLAPYCLSKASYWAVVLELECKPLVEYYAQLRAAVEVETGQRSLQHAHMDRDGNDTLRHHFMPHITLASFESAAQMAAEAPAVLASFARFVGMEVYLDDFKLMSDE